MAPTDMDSAQSSGDLTHSSKNPTTGSTPGLDATWAFDLPNRPTDSMSSTPPVSTDNVTQRLPASSSDSMAPKDLDGAQSPDDQPHSSQASTIDSTPSVVTAVTADLANLELSMARPDPSKTGHDHSKLEQAVTQYPILRSLASVLPFRDLVNLASTSKAAVLYSKPLGLSTTCGGFGIPLRLKAIEKQMEKDRYRNAHVEIIPNRYPKNYPSGYAVLTCSQDRKLCNGCGDFVCNECRVHCYYSGKAFRPSTTPPDHHFLNHIPPMWAGVEPPPDLYYARLSTVLDLESGDYWWGVKEGARQIRPIGGSDLTHDAGKVPLKDHVDMYTHRFGVSEILDLDLGQYEEGANAFFPIIQLRKRWTCKDCPPKPGLQFIRSASDPIPEGPPRYCSCTLRKRFLDRWTCIPCAKSECQKDMEHYQSQPTRKGKRNFHLPFTPKNCACGVSLTFRNIFISCNWCGGEIKARDWAK